MKIRRLCASPIPPQAWFMHLDIESDDTELLSLLKTYMTQVIIISKNAVQITLQNRVTIMCTGKIPSDCKQSSVHAVPQALHWHFLEDAICPYIRLSIQ